jgi:hypothetical protein
VSGGVCVSCVFCLSVVYLCVGLHLSICRSVSVCIFAHNPSFHPYSALVFAFTFITALLTLISIDVAVRGVDGTPYERGTFKLQIDIPHTFVGAVRLKNNALLQTELFLCFLSLSLSLLDTLFFRPKSDSPRPSITPTSIVLVASA